MRNRCGGVGRMMPCMYAVLPLGEMQPPAWFEFQQFVISLADNQNIATVRNGAPYDFTEPLPEPSWVCRQIERLPNLQLVSYSEKATVRRGPRWRLRRTLPLVCFDSL